MYFDSPLFYIYVVVFSEEPGQQHPADAGYRPHESG